jgi:methyl-accepting chemotaxis protein
MTDQPHFRMHRPPWWPENQPWPPQGRFATPFFRRLGCFFGLFYLLGITLFVLLVALILRTIGPVDYNTLLRWAIPLGLVALVLIVLIVSLAILALRRISGPLDDLLEAAGRVAEGDYSTHVEEKGAPEIRSLARLSTVCPRAAPG